MSRGEIIYKKVFKDPWPYWMGGIFLGFINICMLLLVKKPWKITSGFLYWAAWIFRKAGGSPESWEYFHSPLYDGLVEKDFMVNGYTFQNIGIIVGALLAVLLANSFKLKKIKNKKQVVSALAGGILMGYGTRMTYGCNIGALFSPMASMSLSGWVYGIFMFVGAWIGSKILVKYLL
ncbi:MAG: YeeE/YedE thiosulfate transporter family protein [Thermotaleaceae bacterium]